MTKFFFSFVIFLVAGGFLLHFGTDVPWVSCWLGKLPGDFFIQKKDSVVYFPAASAAICSFTFSLLTWLCLGSKKSQKEK